MTAKHAILAGMVAAGLALSGAAVSVAQEAGIVNEAAAPAERRPEDNWLKVCSDLDDGRKACIMRQVVTNSGVFVGSFLVRDDPSQESRLLAVAAMPLGVLLPYGMSWQIDGGKPVRVPYMLCDPQACSAQLVLNEAYVQSLKRGGTLRLAAMNRLGQEVGVEVTLQGFTAVYDDPDGIDIEELNAANSTENALDRLTQDYAEQMRRQLEGSLGGSEAEAPAPEEAPAE